MALRKGGLASMALPPEDAPMVYAPSLAVLLPCYNEALTLAKVISDFRRVLPEAQIYVFDNNSSDGSAEIALANGAILRRVALQGKGNVVRRMFSDVQADVYLMADADSTYDASRARELIAPILDGTAEMVVGIREGDPAAFPSMHVFGNRVFNLIVERLFGRGLRDIFSGYRAFSRRFVKSFPAHSEYFEIETELSVYVLEQRIPMLEIPLPYGKRPPGSVSKLRTFHDGMRILLTILRLFKEARPLAFFSIFAMLLSLISVILAVPVVLDWMETGVITRQPTLILCTGLGLLAALSFLGGMVLDSMARTYREIRHLHYLDARTRQ